MAVLSTGSPVRLRLPTMPTVAAGTAELYYEVRGGGPPVLFIMGATGDGGHFTRVAELLADEFTVVTYDRRGNSRSPRPSGWSGTSIAEQADDAVALLRALDLVPAAVFATSLGAVYGVWLVLHRPEMLRGAILHEPGLRAVLARREQAAAQTRQAVENGLAAGGPPGAVEAFWRHVAGDAGWDALPASVRERILGNGETLVEVEVGSYESYRPDDAELAAVELPVMMLAGEETLPRFVEAAAWVADRLGVEVERVPGGHAAYHTHPRELVDVIRPFLRRL
jgi:pimeloyl-ACP methyl ester carboxylesterase